MHARFASRLLLAAASMLGTGAARAGADAPATHPLPRAETLSASVLRFDGSGQAPAANVHVLQQVAFELRRTDPTWPDAVKLTERALAQAGPDEIPIAVVDVPLVRVFVAATMRDKTYRGASVVFTLDRENWTGSGAPPAWMALDCGDTLGFRVVHMGDRIPAHYATAGTKLLRLRAGSSPASFREARFTLSVERLTMPVPDDTLHVAGTTPYAGATNTGDAYVYLAGGHRRIVHPLVVVEGFDLSNNQNWDELYVLLDREDLIERVRARGLDLVVLNFADATDYIQRNAFVLVTLLEQIQSVADPSEPLIVVGASSGGVIAHYALAWMETHGVPHRVSMFLSMDSPHLGADVPLGIQYWFNFFSDFSSGAAFIRDRLNSPAARQILIYHFTGLPSGLPAPDPLRRRLMTELGAMGWPRTPRKVAVANGSGTGIGQGFAPGDLLLRYNYHSLLRRIDSSVWAVTAGGPGPVFDGRVSAVVPLKAQTVNTIDTHPLDNAPGGWRTTLLQMDTTAVPYGDIVAIHPRHCFVPTVSALALSVPDLFHPVLADPAILAHTPFDTVYCPVENQDHVMVTPENAEWMEQEIARAAARGSLIAAVPPPGALGLRLLGENPFRDAAHVAFRVPEGGRARLTVLDLAGRRIATILDGRLEPGDHVATWSGRTDRGRPVEAGLYFLKLEIQGKSQTVRLTRLE